MRIGEIIQDLDELRREPGRNPRIPVAQALSRELSRSQGSQFGSTEFTNLFLHMSDIVKLGFNPRADYGETADSATPAGIYAYPAEYALTVTGGDQNLRDLPYGGDRAYAHLFGYQGDPGFPALIDLQDLTEDQIRELLVRGGWDRDLLRDYGGSPGLKFWRFTHDQAMALGRDQQRPATRQIAPISLRWREILTDMGIRTVIDRRGVIFAGEDLQAVFLYPQDLDQTALLHNRWDTSSQQHRAYLGQQQKSRRESDWWEKEQEEQRQIIATGDLDEIDGWLARNRSKDPQVIRGFLRKIKDPRVLTRIIGRVPTLISKVDSVSPQLVMGSLEELGRDPVSAGYLWRAVDRRWSRSPHLYSELTKLLIAEPRSGWQQQALEYLTQRFQGVDGLGYPGLPPRLRDQALAQLQGQ